YIGRLVPRKGVDTLVEALALLSRHLDARLVIVGGEPGAEGSAEVARLSALARKLKVKKRVTFTGSRPQQDLYRYYGAADAAVTVPHYEPFGMTPLETMACGVPVVGSRVGGIKTSVVDGETGYLVPPKDPKALADRLLRLLTDGALRERMGLAGRRRMEEHYTWERIATLAAATFSEVAAGAPRISR
ncbi:MAG TPA: glycosyltransferase, partial [Rubrobacteraceae bacterium]|nr:glycosyltransferase [Rubrobacteraceae bacterium]